ncbi:hypothetical protein Tco_0847076 [Tanacetum coccineum]
MYSIIYDRVHGIIYKNSKKEKKVMRHSEIHKFCDATLNRVLEGLKSYNNDVKYGYIQRDLNEDELEYLKLFEEEIEVRLKYRNQMRRWEMIKANGDLVKPLAHRRTLPTYYLMAIFTLVGLDSQVSISEYPMYGYGVLVSWETDTSYILDGTAYWLSDSVIFKISSFNSRMHAFFNIHKRYLMSSLSQESPDSAGPGLLRASDRRSESTSFSESSTTLPPLVPRKAPPQLAPLWNLLISSSS